MRQRRKYKWITQDTLSKAQYLTDDMGFKQTEVIKLLNMSPATYWKAKKAGFDLGRYKELNRATNGNGHVQPQLELSDNQQIIALLTEIRDLLRK